MAHMIEIAKSGRAGCRTCRKPIAKGDLRFGEEAANAFGDATEASYRWHHMKCAAQKLSGELRGALATYEGEVPEREEIERLIAEAEAKKPPPFPYADHAPTARARCQGCGEAIPKGAVRVAVERDVERGMAVTKAAGYLHPACAAAYVEQNGGTHAELTDGLRKNTRALSDDELERLFAEV